MRFQASRNKKRNGAITLNLASMIDVTFLLLIYFLVTSIIAQNEDQLNPTLQTQSSDASGMMSDFQPQVVEVVLIDGTPAYRIGQSRFNDAGSLRAALKNLPTDPGLFVKVKDHVSVGFAVAAVQAARDVGFEQVTYVPAE